MKRKLSIPILAMYIATIEFFKWLPTGFKQLFNWIKVSSKNFPEIITLPIGVLMLCIYPILMDITGINALFQYFHDNPSEPNRGLKALEIMLVAMIYVFLANAAAYAAIKYNRADLWEVYKDTTSKNLERYTPSYVDLGTKELRFYWACYFFGILAAIFLAHSLILI